MIRISSGIFKNRVLKTSRHNLIRPTTSRVKLSFFDILQQDVRETIFLDGFAGSGNIGIEALSRGAEYLVFIDDLPEALALIKHNLDKINVSPDKYRIVKGDFNRSVIALAQGDLRFDIIYLDPPYELLRVANPLKVVFKRKILKPGGMVVLERPAAIDRFRDLPFLHCFRSQKIGKKTLDFFTYPENSNTESDLP